MIDIIGVEAGTTGDMQVYDTNIEKAKNVLSIQLGALSYLELFGIDLRYFLSSEFEFQNTSFNSYLVQVLATNGINVTSITEVTQALYNTLGIEIGSQPTSTSLIAR